VVMRSQTKLQAGWDRVLGRAQSQRKNWATVSGGESLLENETVVIFLSQRSISA
jgi:hypothetical protein